MNLIDQYLKEITSTLASKTASDYRERLTKFSAWQKETGTAAHNRQSVVEYLQYLKESKVGPASIALHKSTLKSFYSWLQENEHIARNPIQNLKMGSYRSNPKGDDCAFTVGEYEAVKEHCTKLKYRFHYWRGAVIVAWNTGLRLGDIANLQWTQIDLANKRIDVTPQKTVRFNKQVEIPILPELAEFLSSLKPAGPYLFESMHAQYAEEGGKHLSQQFTRICEAAGVHGKSFHLLRHSYTSRLLNKNVPASIVSSITGHTLRVLQRYSHVRFEEKQSIVEGALA